MSLEAPAKLALIAGNGQFPVSVAQAARAQGIPLYILAIEGEAVPELEQYAAALEWIKPGHLQRMFGLLQQWDIKRLVMAGQIRPVRLFSEKDLDPGAAIFLATLPDKRADTILGAVAKLLSQRGIEVLSSSLLVADLIPQPGVLGQHQPTPAQLADVRLGIQVAKTLAGLDVGQSVVVKAGAVVAVEAIEGTDAAIRRGAALAGEGVVLVKVSKPRQDARFDLPVVGLQTVRTMVEAKGAVIAIEAGSTVFLEQAEAISLTDTNGLVLLAHKGEGV